jgi:CBS-domain-containing membrane protein
VMLPLPQVTVVGPDDPLADLLPRLEPGPGHQALVVDGGRLIGIVSPSDIARTVEWLTTTFPRRQGH